MRILLAHAFYRVAGGEDRYVEQQAELLARHHDVELYAMRNEDLGGPGSAARKMFFPGKQQAELHTLAESFRPEIVHVHNIYPSIGPAAHQTAKRRGIPLVMTVHNHRLRCPNGYCFTEGEVCHRCTQGNHTHALLHPCFPSKAQAVGYASALWIDRFVRHLEHDVALFIAPSSYMHDRLIEWDIAPARIRLIRNFAPQPELPARERTSVGMYAGRLSSEKGLDVLLHALARSDDPLFEIFGDGPLGAQLRSLADELGLRRTKFMGRVDKQTLGEALAKARYFVMPSLSDENAPLAVLEAMAAGVAVIVARRGGLPELIEHPELVVEPGDPISLSKAIDRIKVNDELRASAADQGKWFVSQHLLPAGHLAQLEAAYESVLAGDLPK